MKVTRKWRRTWQRLAIVATVTIAMTGSSVGRAMPAGEQIVTGNAAIVRTGQTMNINQTTAKVSINWNSFGVATGEKVSFIQPSNQAIALNRVIGNNPSAIYGQITANGKVFLINPNGILFAPGSQVNVGGLVASTLNLSDRDFIAGKYNFSGNGGSVINKGNLTSSEGGYVALLGAQVSNQGIIVARQGTVALGGGNQVTLDFKGDGLLNMVVDQSAVRTMVENKSMIYADGGQVIMTAQAANALVNTVLNNSGIIQARSVSQKNGIIRLEGGNAGVVSVSGKLDVSGYNTGEVGGAVYVSGEKISLTGNAGIDASGANRGGTILIGGKNTKMVSSTTLIEKGVSINANATINGDGGKVTLWSSDKTEFNGSISARGGDQGGNGGQVEVSGKNKLSYYGLTDLRASVGNTGSLLLDPNDFLISSSGGDITGADLGNQLNFANVSILSEQGAQAGNGDIWVNDSVTWSTNNSLQLSATRNINISQSITASGGGAVVMKAGNGGAGVGTVAFSGDGKVVLSDNSTLKIYYNPSSYTTPTNYSTYTSGTGTVTPYMLVNNLTQLQKMSFNLAGSYALATDIDAYSTSEWNAGLGFNPIGTSSKGFSGKFDGQNYTITGLAINRPSSDYIGLFGKTGTAVIENVGLVDAKITGRMNVGGLVGLNGGSISNSYNTGTVSGDSTAVGGLVGKNASGNISNSYSTANVGGYSYVGGLVGYNNIGIISNSFSSGSVSAIDREAGGLVGRNNLGTISYSHSSSPTNGYSYVGGLVGLNYSGTIANSYSTGAVNGADIEYEPAGGGASIDIGGLVGANHGGTSAIINNSYSNSSVKGFLGVGGLVGYSNGVIRSSYSTGEVHGNTKVGGLVGKSSGWITDSYSSSNVYGYDFVGGFGGNNDGSIINSYSTGAVYGSKLVGGFMGYNASIGSISDSYWNTNTSGQTNSSGGTGLTTTEMMSQPNYASGWDFTNTWRIYDGYTYPLLKGFLTPLYITANNIATTYDGTYFAGGNGVSYSSALSSEILGSIAYSGTSQGARNAGQYGITINGLYSGQQGYDINYRAGTLTITPAVLTLSATSNTKTYDGTTAANAKPTVSNLQNGDSVTGLTEGYTDIHAGENKMLIVSAYTIDDGNGGNNYTVNVIENNTGVITQRNIVIHARDQSKTYGNFLDVDSLSIGRRVSLTGGTVNDPITGVALTSAGTDILAHTGKYEVVVNADSIIFANGYRSDYNIGYDSGVITVNPRSLIVAARNQSKTYGDPFDFGLKTINQLVGVYGAVASDPVNLVSMTSPGSDVNTHAGSYAIVPSAITFANGVSSDYKITYKSGAFTVNPRLVTITAVNQAKVLGSVLDFGLQTLTQKVLISNQAAFDPVTNVLLTSMGSGGDAMLGKYDIMPSGAQFTTGYATDYRIIYKNGILTILQ